MPAIDQQMRELLRTPGVRSVCLVDRSTGQTLTTAGEADRTADAVALLAAATEGPLRHAGVVEDLVVTDHTHHLLFAPLHRSDLCLRVRMDRRGNLALALRGLRALARTAQVPPSPPRRPGLPHRGDHEDTPRPRPRVAAGVDRGVLERVLAALRNLAAPTPCTGSLGNPGNPGRAAA
ncbi:hypothetical protein IDM40_21280 [Nocardiopsis sp. HNM0947]|uniref:Roadblock/LAMTOR2 domain-containing protein n=1 Tax=Nocardiopsis coralli TaxID=2772213 RepID=A0ABR9PBX0_9ACTN|nr:hypothetical protein [Nocardiopsis coralli]MBE3001205.1 hypothetical protein [Nocardiopsis coralli]